MAALAATRLIRAWFFEEIGKKPRAVLEKKLSEVSVREDGSIDMRRTRIRFWFGDLTGCPHCLGFWVTLGCVVLYRLPLPRVVLNALAGSLLLSTFVQWYPGFDLEELDEDELHIVVETPDEAEARKDDGD